MPSQISTSIQPTTLADIPAIIKIGRENDATKADRHTELKRLGNISYLNPDDNAAIETFKTALKKDGKYVFIKAVNDTNNEVLGSASFYFQGFEKDEIPKIDIGEEDSTPVPAVKSPQEEAIEPLSEEKKRINARIDQLEEMEDEDMQRMQEILMPPGTKCIIIAGLGVSPRFQYQGVGAALVKWGTDHADRNNVFMWVHSAEASYRVYAKSGFEVVETLDIDLDAWAPAPPPEEVGGVIWGRYLVRYMKRLPKGVGEDVA